MSKYRWNNLSEGEKSQIINERVAGTEIQALANKYNVSKNVIIWILKKANIKDPKRKRSEITKDIAEVLKSELENGVSFEDIAVLVNRTPRVLRIYAKKNMLTRVMPTLKCEVCWKPYKATTKKDRYCSEKCRKKGTLGIHFCKYCGVMFSRSIGKQEFCSVKCYTVDNTEWEEKAKEEISSIYNGRIKITKYNGSNGEAVAYCDGCGEEFKKNYYLLAYYKSGCPKCDKTNSRAEDEISQILNDIGANFTKEYKFSEFEDVKRYRYDFALLDEDVVTALIEYDGEQHFEPISIFGGEKEFRRIQISDRKKSEFAKKIGVPLLRIPFWERKRLREIIEHEYLKLKKPKDRYVNQQRR